MDYFEATEHQRSQDAATLAQLAEHREKQHRRQEAILGLVETLGTLIVYVAGLLFIMWAGGAL